MDEHIILSLRKILLGKCNFECSIKSLKKIVFETAEIGSRKNCLQVQSWIFFLAKFGDLSKNEVQR